ncbi:hypothetical protein F5050DRAFT_1580319, partial [Lentinula boryana]
MKKRANNACYRETGYSHETQSEYFIRKNDLLTTVYENDDSLLISEIMSGAPTIWETILTTQVYQTTVELQSAIKFHEETLMSLPSEMGKLFNSNLNWDNNRSNRTRTDFPPPGFPPDDLNISKRRQTPEERGVRACRWCGSFKHWDDECKHQQKKTAHTCLAITTMENLQAQDDYDD